VTKTDIIASPLAMEMARKLVDERSEEHK